MSLSPGSTVGRYEILSVLGVGGMGEVYRARDSRLHRDVAIKVLPPAVSADTERLARFDREVAPMHTVQLGAALYLERQYEAAIELCQQVLTLEPHFWAATLFLGQCYDVCGRTTEAIQWLRTASQLSADNPMALASLGHALARSGQTDAAIAHMSELDRRLTTRYVPRYAFALICAGLGRDNDALQYLEEACEERSPAIPLWLGGEPRLDGLRSHRRFQQIAERVGVV